MSIMDRSSFRLDDIEKTWIFDLDGTLVVHNGYKNGVDVLLSVNISLRMIVYNVEAHNVAYFNPFPPRLQC